MDTIIIVKSYLCLSAIRVRPRAGPRHTVAQQWARSFFGPHGFIALLGFDGVPNDAGKVGKQSAEAVHRKVIIGHLGLGFALGSSATLRWGHNARAADSGIVRGVVIERDGSQAISHLPFDIAGQHAKKDMSHNGVSSSSVSHSLTTCSVRAYGSRSAFRSLWPFKKVSGGELQQVIKNTFSPRRNSFTT